ncbi:Tubulin-specific chaperone [Dirofilaria immitis]
MTLHELKEKLQLVVGNSIERMRAELHDKDGKFISSLTDNQATLEKLGVTDGMQHHIAVFDYENVSAVEKYTISEEKYDEREDSVRAWKRRESLKIKYDALIATENEAKQFKIGDRCMVHVSNQHGKRGIISYIGPTKFKSGCWIGVTYDEPFGKHDGSVNGERYFTCKNNHGKWRKYEIRIGSLFPVQLFLN